MTLQPGNASPPFRRPRGRARVIGGWLISREDGTKWANLVFTEGVIPNDLLWTPAVLQLIDEDFQNQGGIGVWPRTPDVPESRHYIVVTQMKYGHWVNSAQDNTEAVLDPEEQSKPEDYDEAVRKQLRANGIEPLGFGNFYL